jgi:hypothetical protein
MVSVGDGIEATRKQPGGRMKVPRRVRGVRGRAARGAGCERSRPVLQRTQAHAPRSAIVKPTRPARNFFLS